MSAKELHIPLLNANERDAQLVDLNVQNGQAVKAGDVLYTLETTKSTAEVTAEEDGFIAGIQVGEGTQVSAGDLFGYLADSKDWKPATKAATESGNEIGPAGLRITAPARALAEAEGIDLASLPVGPLVTEAMVRAQFPKADLPEPERLDDQNVVIYGGGGHGKSLIELVKAAGQYEVIGVIDDGLKPGEMILGIPVLGGGGKLAELYSEGIHLAVNAVGGIGDVRTRIKVFERIEGARFSNPSMAHPTAFIEASASLADGTQVFPFAYVGSDVRTGFGSIINTSAVVSHDCSLGAYVNIAPGAILAGGVQVGAGSLVGMGATVNLSVRVGEGCIVGNGATVKAEVPDGTMVRAGSIWPA
jgi:sugar O-acyltransferase (sialic acid O-acetyltransferase NeuD family)